MLKDLKCIFYMRHVILMATINKVRFFLTFIGLFISVFVFSLGSIITNSYYKGSMQIVDDMKDNTIVVETYETNSNVKKEITKVTNTVATDSYLMLEKKSIFSTQIDDKRYLNVMANVHGMSQISSIVPIVTDDSNILPIEATIIKGRGISTTDISNRKKVIVIDKFTENMLFPDGNSIGKYIGLGVAINGTTIGIEDENTKVQPLYLEVIGVVENSYLSEMKKSMLMNDWENKEKNISAEVSVYVPINILEDNFSDVEKKCCYFYEYEDTQEYSSTVSKLRALSEITSMQNSFYTVTTQEDLKYQLEIQLSDTKVILNIITLILSIISGISIMSITFFSMKERIQEIGIRKAFGASKVDIIFQFVIEMGIIAFFSSVVAVFMGILTCKMAEDILSEKLYILFSVFVSNEILILPILLGMLEAIIFSIIPSIYAANIKVTDSLRFE